MPPRAKTSAPVEKPTARVGYVYDVRMKNHFELDIPRGERGTDDNNMAGSIDDANDSEGEDSGDSEERYEPHPEDPRRIYWIYDILDLAGCLKLMKPIKVQSATEAQILRVHTRKYLGLLRSTELMERMSLIETQRRFDSVTLCSDSYYCALLSAGGLISLSEEIAKGNLDSGLAIIRPPGHHACHRKAMGFCLLNNVAIAVRDMIAKDYVKKVLIVDWDVHHGNGIQEIFYDDPNVLYFSVHRHDNGTFYPSSKEGGMENVGGSFAHGYNINVPWPSSGYGDGDYMYAFRRLLLPIAQEFKPDMVFIASGFDAAICDPIGQCNVSPECYACMTNMVQSIANGKLVLALEGGYNLDAIANSALGCVKALLGIKLKAGLVPEASTYETYETVPESEINGVSVGPKTYASAWRSLPDWDPEFEAPDCFYAPPSTKGKHTVEEVVQHHKKFWICLNEG